MATLRWLIALLALLAVIGCAPKYHRHVDYEEQELTGVFGVAVLWWKAQQICQISILFTNLGPPAGALGEPTVKQLILDGVPKEICQKKGIALGPMTFREVDGRMRSQPPK